MSRAPEFYAVQSQREDEEKEAEMHARIRGDYDSTVANSWRAHCAKIEKERDTYRAALIKCRTESKWAGHGATVQGLALHAVGDIVEAAFVEVSK